MLRYAAAYLGQLATRRNQAHRDLDKGKGAGRPEQGGAESARHFNMGSPYRSGEFSYMEGGSRFPHPIEVHVVPSRNCRHRPWGRGFAPGPRANYKPSGHIPGPRGRTRRARKTGSQTCRAQVGVETGRAYQNHQLWRLVLALPRGRCAFLRSLADDRGAGSVGTDRQNFGRATRGHRRPACHSDPSQ